MTPPFLVKIHNCFFPYFEPKKCFQVPTPWVFCGRSGTSTYVAHAVFDYFGYLVILGDFTDSVVPTPRGATRDLVTVPTH